MVVMKFGGTSVKDAEAYTRAIEIIRSRLDQKPVVVLSATAGTTDSLLQCSYMAAEGKIDEAQENADGIFIRHINILNDLITNEEQFAKAEAGVKEYIVQLKALLRGIYLLSELSNRSIAKVISYGELISTYVLDRVMKFSGFNSALSDSRDFIITDENSLKGEPQKDMIKQKVRSSLLPIIEEGGIPIVQGFIGRTMDGNASTLGRGGSDWTASLIGMALKADKIEIWTDVNGILTADPRKVNGTRIIKEISFKEAAELAFFGAKVLHPSTIIPAIEENIPVAILNSQEPRNEGTIVKGITEDTKEKIRSITSKENIKVLNIYSPRMLFAYGFLKKIFEVFDKYKTSVDLITTSEVNVSITLDNEERITEITKELSEFSEVMVEDDKSLVCLVGKDIKYTKGITKEIFGVLEKFPITMISQGASAINISFVVERKDLSKVLQTLHDEFFIPADKN